VIKKRIDNQNCIVGSQFLVIKQTLFKLFVLLRLMFKKYGSILMMFTALAILLGHNLIPHHHHDFEQVIVVHNHHSDDHHHASKHHHGDEEDENNEDEESDFKHLFSHFQHSEDDVTFLSNHSFTSSLSKQLYPSSCVLTEAFVFQNIGEFVRQNSPPYKDVHRNSQYHLPTGLRAPPTFIV